MKKKKLKQINASAHLIQYRFKICEVSPENNTSVACIKITVIVGHDACHVDNGRELTTLDCRELQVGLPNTYNSLQTVL